jgi:IS4 transposase
MLVQSGVCADNNQQLGEIKRGDLRIEDLGYFKLDRFQGIEKAGGFYLSRLRYSVNVYLKEQDHTPLDLLKLQRRMKQGERIVLQVYLGKDQKLPTRLIIEKVPTQVSNEKRRRLKTQKPIKRKKISKERLELCNINIIITNTTESTIPAERVGVYYSLRWQIEIVFKAWKSVYQIDKMKNMKLQRFECIHYGTLILIILTTNLLAYCKRELYIKYKLELSEFKLFKTIKGLILEFKKAIAKSKIGLIKFLQLLQEMAYRTCRKHRKKGKLTPFDIYLA